MRQQHVVDITLLGPVVRRVFPGARSVSVEPASPGRLLVVYRVRADGVSYYLRVAEEAGEDLTTDAQVLARLAGLGVRVPAVVHVEAGPGDLDRSFLIVAALAGESLASHGTDEEACRAVRAAGRDAALINAIEVEGFGWLRRDGLPGLRAELACHAEFVASDLPGRWPGWLVGAFTGGELAGYAEAATLAGDNRDLIRRSAIVSGLRQLSLWLGPGHNDSPAGDRARTRVIQLRNLLAGRPPTASG